MVREWCGNGAGDGAGLVRGWCGAGAGLVLVWDWFGAGAENCAEGGAEPLRTPLPERPNARNTTGRFFFSPSQCHWQWPKKKSTTANHRFRKNDAVGRGFRSFDGPLLSSISPRV